MRIFIVDAFASARFQGNQAGVVLLAPGMPAPEPDFMQSLAAELKHSETVFVRSTAPRTYELRYFTPLEEVELCGHATVAAFSVLRQEEKLALGNYSALTRAGSLCVELSEDAVWMDMAPARELYCFSPAEAGPLYAAFGLTPAALPPKLVSTGLADILLPVADVSALQAARMDRQAVLALSEKYEAVGFHLFSLGEGAAAHCRNFAPRVGIDEECATGTANGALTYYLLRAGLICPERENRFLQGEAMGRPSEIRTLVTGTGKIRVGGRAVISLRCRLQET